MGSSVKKCLKIPKLFSRAKERVKTLMAPKLSHPGSSLAGVEGITTETLENKTDTSEDEGNDSQGKTKTSERKIKTWKRDKKGPEKKVKPLIINMGTLKCKTDMSERRASTLDKTAKTPDRKTAKDCMEVSERKKLSEEKPETTPRRKSGHHGDGDTKLDRAGSGAGQKYAKSARQNTAAARAQPSTRVAAPPAQKHSSAGKQATSTERNTDMKSNKGVRKRIEAPSPDASVAYKRPRQASPKLDSKSSKPARLTDHLKIKPIGRRDGVRNLKISMPRFDRDSRQVEVTADSSGSSRVLSELCDGERSDASTPGTASADETDKRGDMTSILKRLTARTLRGDFKIPKRRLTEQSAPPAFDNFTITVPADERPPGDGTACSAAPADRHRPAPAPAAARAAEVAALSQPQLPAPPPRPPAVPELPPPPPLPQLALWWPTAEDGSDATAAVTAPPQPVPPPVPWPAAAARHASSTQCPTAGVTSEGYRTAATTPAVRPVPPPATSTGYPAPPPATSTGYPVPPLARDRAEAARAGCSGHRVSPSGGPLTERTAGSSGPTDRQVLPTVGRTAPSASSHDSEEQDDIVVVQEDEEGVPADLRVTSCRGVGEVVLIPDHLEPAPLADRPAYEFCEFVSDDPAENADNNAVEWEVMRRLSSDSERYRFVRQRWRNTEIPDPHQCLTFYGYRRRLVRANLQRMGLAGRRPREAQRGRGLKRTLSATSWDGRPASKRQRLAASCAFVADWLLEQGRTLRTAGRVVPSLREARRRMEEEAVRFCRQLAFNLQLTPSQRQWELDHLLDRQQRQLQLEFGPRTRRAAHRLNAAKAETETFFRFYTGLNNSDAENASWLTEQQRRDVQEFEEYLVGQDRVYGPCLDEDF